MKRRVSLARRAQRPAQVCLSLPTEGPLNGWQWTALGLSAAAAIVWTVGQVR